MESYDLMSSDHFHVVLHPDRKHGIIFNRLDSTVTTIDYNDAKELSNLKLIARTYGIIGRFSEKYLVLIKSCRRIGSLYEPDTKTNHDVYVINQVQVIDISPVGLSNVANMTTNASSRSSNNSDTHQTHPASCANGSTVTSVEQHELKERYESDEYSSLPVTISTNSYNSAQSRAAQWNPFRLASSLRPSQILKSAVNDSSPQSCNETKGLSDGNGESSQQDSIGISPQQQQTLDDADRRLAEEMMKLFNNTNSFYFSPTLDLTNRFSRRCTKTRSKGNEPLWKTADERFFWNKFMLKDIIDLSNDDPDANYFICIILQGFISIEHRYSFTIHRGKNDFQTIDIPDNSSDGIEVGQLAIESTNNWSVTDTEGKRDCDTGEGNSIDKEDGCKGGAGIEENKSQDSLIEKTNQLALISRRSVFQAGTRYRRRGCDESGNCANFVETEQIFRTKQHFTSTIIIRGSIPLFWFQSGFNYRPPPVLSRCEEENHKAFTKHFENLFYAYETDQIISVDCTEHTGREKVLHDAFRKHMDRLKQEKHANLKLIEFDFHKYCRGRQCSDDQIKLHLSTCGLTEKLLKEAQYYWNDGDVVWKQKSVFRVNCLDCSDRTNVVQRNIALQILDLQLARLGIISPDSCPEENQCRKTMSTMWSANGNVLSTQYCGTRALFGGDSKKLTGYLKDTYSSASRYYISKFRDAYRQAAIDAMLGIESAETKNLKQGSDRDQYELLSFDPVLAGGRSGGALLRDVGSRVGDRLARLRGRISHVRPFGHTDTSNITGDSMSRFQSRPSSSAYVVNNSALRPASGQGGRHNVHDERVMVETGLIENLGRMNIDWPTSESLEDIHQYSLQPSNSKSEKEKKDFDSLNQDVFARFSDGEECFQDDDFGQLTDDY